MGQYADLFASIVSEQQDMPELMAGEGEALDRVKKLASDLNGDRYNVEIGFSEITSQTCLRIGDSKGDLAIIPFKIEPNQDPKMPLQFVFAIGWGSGEARFNLADEAEYRQAAETLAIQTMGQIHNEKRAMAAMRHLHNV